MKSRSDNWQNSAFTIVEVLLTVALIGVMAGVSLPVAQNLQNRNDLDAAVTQVAQSLRRAQALAQAVDGDTSWGVSVDDSDNNKIILFQGTSFVGRDSSYDEEFELPSVISAAGVTEVVFAKFTGLPGSTGTLTLAGIGNQERELAINSYGTVDY